jgi:aromatic amino acid aminotransferase I
MLAERKIQIYDICSRYDVIIVEDEPYWTLFLGDWIPRGKKPSPLVEKQMNAEKNEGSEGNAAFIAALPPSYLAFDTDGRVIRLDVSDR